MVVHVKRDSESGDTIATLNINANGLIKHVKEQIEATTGIHKAKQCLCTGSTMAELNNYGS